MSVTAVAALCLLVSATVLFIKRYTPEHAILLSVAAGAILSAVSVASAAGMLIETKELFESAGLSPELFKTVLKALGICYITSFAADICRDFGQASLAAKAELCGKLATVALTLPLTKEILSAALELIG